MKKIDFTKTVLQSGLLKERQDTVINTTVMAVYNRFKETGRFEALKCNWKDGDENQPHFFWDSDVAKWIEGVSYLLMTGDYPELKKIAEDAIDDICENAEEDGYFNSYFLTVEKGNRFTKRDFHELYCAGHLIEAAIAYSDATGDDKFLNAMCKYADFIDKVFRVENSANFVTPGHPELELALYKLYAKTGNVKYLELLKFFIEMHGNNKKDLEDGNLFLKGSFNIFYNQDECLLKDRNTAEGHSVRCMYLLCGMADYAKEYNDKEMLNACLRVFENIIKKRMYITGGIGTTPNGEAFTVDYDLPSREAYAETCAGIALVMFTERMQNLLVDSRFADAAERVLYNGVLSGLSADGKSFFYLNPLEIVPQFNNNETSATYKKQYPITQRKEVFNCSCCPPNIVRFIPSITGIMYSEDDDTLYVHHFADSVTDFGNTKISQKTLYPYDGKIIIKYNTDKKVIAFRIPGWCKNYKISKNFEVKSGYAYVVCDKSGEIEIDFEMKPYFVYPNAKIYDCAGKVAVMRGPVVYCAEGCDNDGDLYSYSVDTTLAITVGEKIFNLPSLIVNAKKLTVTDELYSDNIEYENTRLKLIPYYSFANRGESEMRVWLNRL